MRVIYGIGKLARGPSASKVVAVGVFDGVHRGHQLILRSVLKEAKKNKLLSAVVTFTKHPSGFFNPAGKIPHLTSLEHKLSLIRQTGIEVCYCIPFNKAFASLSPEHFVKGILLDKIHMASLYVGEDFVFGYKAKGNKRLLRQMSRQFHFKVHILKHLKIKNRIVSSTLIRELIARGDLDLVKTMLGRRVSFLGQVIKGDGRGKILGFPTANLRPHHEVLAPNGIYASEAVWNQRLFPSVTYIGTKPTFSSKRDSRSIEVFLFDFKKNIYGQKIEVRLIKKIRKDKKFSSSANLVIQMKKDILSAKKIFQKSS